MSLACGRTKENYSEEYYPIKVPDINWIVTFFMKTALFTWCALEIMALPYLQISFLKTDELQPPSDFEQMIQGVSPCN